MVLVSESQFPMAETLSVSVPLPGYKTVNFRCDIVWSEEVNNAKYRYGIKITDSKNTLIWIS